MFTIINYLPSRERGFVMADEKISPRWRLRIFQRAVWKKSSKFTLSGLIITVVGLVMILIGIDLGTGAYSAEGLLVGFGGIIMIIGIIRLLIGFINPSVPEELPPLEPPREESQPVDSILPEPDRDEV
jgi:hypothetical protein